MCFIRLSEEAENHARVLRQTEEHYRSRLAEMQEEKTLALEEKELHCASLISREQNNQQGLQVHDYFLNKWFESYYIVLNI